MNRTLGVAALGHKETSRAARVLLEEGGNAFDAALGAMYAACVCEPLLASLGGGGVLLLFFGGIQAVGRSARGEFNAAGDPRRGGAVSMAGFLCKDQG